VGISDAFLKTARLLVSCQKAVKLYADKFLRQYSTETHDKQPMKRYA